MKTLIQTAVISAALFTLPAMAQVTQAQQDGSAALVTECALKNAPQNWDALTVALDRTKPEEVLIYNVALLKGGKQVDLNMTGCDIGKQARDLSMFQAIVPAKQAAWKVLFLTTRPTGQYNVYTDIALAKSGVK